GVGATARDSPGTRVHSAHGTRAHGAAGALSCPSGLLPALRGADVVLELAQLAGLSEALECTRLQQPRLGELGQLRAELVGQLAREGLDLRGIELHPGRDLERRKPELAREGTGESL